VAELARIIKIHPSNLKKRIRSMPGLKFNEMKKVNKFIRLIPESDVKKILEFHAIETR
jgi:hypothetical protein